MPKLKETYTAHGEAATSLGLSDRHISLPQNEGLEHLGEGIYALGKSGVDLGAGMARLKYQEDEKTKRLNEKIQRQQDDLDIVKLTTERDMKVGRLKQDLKKPIIDENGNILQAAADPIEHEKLFYEGVVKIQDELDYKNYNSNVQVGFAKHALRKYTEESLQVRDDARRLIVDTQKAAITNRTFDLAKIAGEATTLEDRDSAMRMAHDMIDRGRDNGYLTAEQAAKAKIEFDQKRLADNARFIGKNSPDNFRILLASGAWDGLNSSELIKIEEHVTNIEEKASNRAERVWRKASEDQYDSWYRRANRNEITEGDIADLRDGKVPFLTGAQAHHLSTVVPIGGKQGQHEVAAIWEKFAKSNQTINDVSTARRELRELSLTMPPGNSHVIKLGDHLGGVERAIQSQSRAATGAEQRDINKDVRDAVTMFQSRVPLPDKMANIPFGEATVKYKQTIKDIEIRVRLGMGTWQDIVNEKIDEYSGKENKKPPKQRAIENFSTPSITPQTQGAPLTTPRERIEKVLR